MRCLSHEFLFGVDKCQRGSYKFMRKTRMCYFCARKLKHDYGLTEEKLLDKGLFKKFTGNSKTYLSTIDKIRSNTILP